jgi:formamidopyrimidine-DNA glycosylase
VPEGDTIYRAARALNQALAGRVVTGFETGLAKLARVNDDTPLVGRIVERVESRGKWCLMYFSGDLILVTHMLMSGSWHLYRVGERWRMPRRAMRVVVRVGDMALQAGGGGEADPSAAMRDDKQNAMRDDKQNGMRNDKQGALRGDEPIALRDDRRNGIGDDKPGGWEAVLFNAQIAEFHTARTLDRSSQVPKLGPDVLAGEFTVEGGVARLEAYARDNPDAEVGVVLLNQRVLAGLGNVYKSEVAFAAGVNPWRAMRTVTRGEMEKMVEFSLRYMRANVIDGKRDGIVTYAGNRRTTHSMSKEERLWVYGRAGQECRRCGAIVMMRKQGEQARSTYWCPECQAWVGEGAAPVGNVVLQVRRTRASC